ncbi:MAG: MurR/RpiR family transcriptional regulator [Clostridia bacterium]|nr:MurR/RpiR family transcriptional regulator [Clostridia bacterium]
MSSNMFYLVRLDAMRKKQGSADGMIADYLLANPHKIATLTVWSLAEKTNTSYASVCRFFKKLGLSGFREFKKLFPDTRTSEMRDFSIESETVASFEEISTRICEYSSGVIGSLPRLLRRGEVERTVELMKNAEQVHFIGLGTSAVTAQYAYTKFFRLKHVCSFERDIILAKMKASQMKESSVLFAVSSSGRTKSILEIARIARQNGATIIAICDFENSPLSTMADISICTTVRDSNKYIDTDFPHIQGQITIVDILYAYMYHKTPSFSSRKIKETKDAVDVDKVR